MLPGAGIVSALLRYQTHEDAELDAGPILLDLKRARAAELLLQVREAPTSERVDTAKKRIARLVQWNLKSAFAHPNSRSSSCFSTR